MLKKNRNKIFSLFFVCLLLLSAADIISKVDQINLDVLRDKPHFSTILDRNKSELSLSYMDHWNPNIRSLESHPSLLLKGLVESEDKRFYSHAGIDFLAKIRALYFNVLRLNIHQGGTTISEQVVRILLNSSKSVWNRWIQMWLSVVLESKFSKKEILEFYVNQAPFASNRRGFHQASYLYFNRDLETLSSSEQLALIVMLQSPSAYDIRKHHVLGKKISYLSLKLDLKDFDEKINLVRYNFKQKININSIQEFIVSNAKPTNGKIHSTIDSAIQIELSKILAARLKSLKSRGAFHGSAMVVDHLSGEVLAMISENGSKDSFGFNTSLVPRQTGSTLKPFLYASYFMNGGRPFNLVDDSPISSVIAGGLHEINNYSHHFYGELSMREALGNSLNVPAIKIMRRTGEETLYNNLQQAGITLPMPVSYYGEGLALGNSEISLYEMMQAYTCLANRGQCKKLKIDLNIRSEKAPRIFDDYVSDMILDILSDPKARIKEFGDYRFSHQVAVKTGTSTDFRDAWAFGINRKYLVGVWVGHLDSHAMNEVTGAYAALPVVRSIIESKLLENGQGKFALSPKLYKDTWCVTKKNECEMRDELFVKDEERVDHYHQSKKTFDLVPSSSFLHLAIDPRIPRDRQVFIFKTNKDTKVSWYVDGEPAGMLEKFEFKLKKGTFNISAIDSSQSIEKNIKVYVHE